MKKILLLSTCFLLLTACQSINPSSEALLESTEVSTVNSEGENIPDSQLYDMVTSIDNLDLSSSNVNTLPLYTTLEKGNVGIVKYTNNADYAVTINICNTTDDTFVKTMKIPAHSKKEIRYSAINSTKDCSDMYTIDMHCAESNLNGILSVAQASRK